METGDGEEKEGGKEDAAGDISIEGAGRGKVPGITR
jgi:hypothetical protein